MSESTRIPQQAEQATPSFDQEQGNAVKTPPTFQLTAAAPMQLQEADGQGESLTLTRGELTSTGEGSDAQTSHVHWPETSASGVTLGKGYDIGSRTAAQVIQDLTAAGMGQSQATKISAGAGLKGNAAGTWVNQNKDDVGVIALDVQHQLLATMLEVYTDNAESVATNDSATKDGSGYYTNARGREINDGVEEGTYKMSSDQWENLHPAMVEFLTDLKYQGGYYLYDRVAQVNETLIANDGNHLEQFKGVAALFESQSEGADSYMDRYGQRIGEGSGNTETFYGQTAEELEGATTRRNRIRLAYLKNVISALEAGNDVVFDTDAESGESASPENTTSENTGGEPTLNPHPEVVTPTTGPRTGAPVEEAPASVGGVFVGVLKGKPVGSPGAITEVQDMLKQLGFYSGTSDGLITLRSGGESGTTRAIKAFQADKGLKADGLVGNDTMTAMKSAVNAGKDQPAAEAEVPMTQGVYVGIIEGQAIGSIEAIKEVQTYLKTLGLYSGTIDGLITLRSGNDSGTTKAIKAFQVANNLTVDGLVGSNTLSGLKAAAGAQPASEGGGTETPVVEETPAPVTENPAPVTENTSSGGSSGPVVAQDEPTTVSGNAVTISANVGVRGPNKREDVRKIQGILNRVGLGTIVDGGIGKATNGAIISFQKAVGLGADGVISPTGDTLKKLNATADGAFSNSVAEVQNDPNAPKFNHSKFDNPGKLMQCTDGTVIPPQFYPKIQRLIQNVNKIADNLGVALHVNSGYRSPNYNASLEGSAQASNHQFGEAIDISSPVLSASQLHSKVLDLINRGVISDGGLGAYNTFIHYDVGGAGRRWDLRS